MPNTVDGSRRPSLEPIWTDYKNLGGMPKTAFRPATSPEGLSEPSPMSPRSLPSPMHPASYSSYTTNKQHERAILNSFDGATTTTATVKSGGGGGRAHPSPTTATRLIPIDEEAETPLTARLERFTILPSLTLHYSGLPSPPGAPQIQLYSPQPSREYLQRSRTVLEPGTMSSPRRPVESSSSALSRRNSVVIGTRPLPPPPPPPRKQSVEEIRDQLRSWGHGKYSNFVDAVGLVGIC